MTVTVEEIEQTQEEYPMLLGKGRYRNDLVYFQLDASFLRQPKQSVVGGRLRVTQDEIIGTAAGHFAIAA